MKTNAYSIRDVKADVFHAPFFLPTDGAATRAFSDVANDLTTQIGRHPADFTLFHIGSFDDATGYLEHQERRHVVDASSLVKHQPSGDLLEFSKAGRTA